MFDIHRIIVPVDFNIHTETLANFSINVARKFNGKITFIHVVKKLPDYSDYGPDTLSDLERNLLAHAEKKMESFMKEMRKKYLECEGEILIGDAAEAIISCARKTLADLVIISTHGAQGVEKVLLGSVADRVIKGVSCPTMVFNPFKNEKVYEA